MTRTRIFWILLTISSLGATIGAYFLFPRAFPIVSLDITMDRERALGEAARIAASQHFGPAGFRQAASFELDEDVQTFVELEGGGKDAFARLMRERLYSPYTWHVRHFKERDANETSIRFEPDGSPYGFVERLSEDAPGTTVSADEARHIAETTAAREWRADFSRYRLVEQSQARKPKGRVDHRLVYQRQDETLGEGRYRIQLVVSGDRLTALTHFITIPEAFQRRYEQMRSANNAIGAAATIALLLVYGVGGIALGLFWLLRDRWVIWRQPVIWGFSISLLQVLDAPVNKWPLLWMQYETALSTRAYVVEQLSFAAAGFLALGVVFTLSFMAAESLTRRAFPSHPQLWRTWSRDAASSTAVVGRTVAGILLVGLFFAYEVVLYYFAIRLHGWWSPSEALFHPDVLAAYLPWFSALAPSLQAGFWEECLFRAVPIAGAALIGDRVGHRKLMIAIAFVVQAIVFGGGHAPYPAQPAYARVVELILPSMLFGLLYLRFGLVPAIVLHFLFDTVWFALPLFVSTAPGIWIDRTMVILLALLPLWIAIAARLRAGRWTALPDTLRNGAWRPPALAVRPVPIEEDRPAAMPAATQRLLRLLAPLAIIVWALASVFRTDIPRIEIRRTAASDVARRAVTEQGGRLTPDWRLLPRIDDGRGDAHRFVLDRSGPDVFVRLLGSYLEVPHWIVRGVTFEGDVAERADEWTVDVSGSGSVQSVRHALPEARPGAALSDRQAREIASAFLEQRFALTREKVREVAMEPSQLVNRTDWTATFADLDTRGLKEGELRISVRIAGDRVVGSERFVYISEGWERQRRGERTVALVASLIGGLALVALLIAEGIVAVVSWSRRAFAVRLFLAFFALQVVMRVITAINEWPARVAGFSTAQSFPLQRAQMIVVLAVGAFVPSAVIALIIGAAPIGVRRSPTTNRERLILGGALGAIAAAAMVLGNRLASGATPAWPSVAGADTLMPPVAVAVSVIASFLLWTVSVLIIVMAADQVTRGWTRWKIPVANLILLVGISMGAIGAQGSQATWLTGGGIIGLAIVAAYVGVLRYEPAVLPIAIGVVSALSAVRFAALRSFPGAAPGAIAGALLALAVAWWWSRALAHGAGVTTDDATA